MKECCNCKHCDNHNVCTLFDELCLITGHCYMWNGTDDNSNITNYK